MTLMLSYFVPGEGSQLGLLMSVNQYVLLSSTALVLNDGRSRASPHHQT